MVPALLVKLGPFGFTHNSQERGYRQIIIDKLLYALISKYFVFVLILKLLCQTTNFVVRLLLITGNIALKTRESYSRQLLNINGFLYNVSKLSLSFLIQISVFLFLSGISSEVILKPKYISQEELLDMTLKLNKDSTVSGVLVQLPLPGGCYLTPYIWSM